MRARCVLAPEAALDLAEIWLYIKKHSSVEMADQVESTIRNKMLFLARTPGAGHSRNDLTSEPVRFPPVYSYPTVCRPDKRPMEVVAILHGHRDVESVLKNRL